MKRLLAVLLPLLVLTYTPCRADEEPDPNAPHYTVTPEKVDTAKTTVGDSVLVAEFTIQHHNITRPTTMYIGGLHRDMFVLEKESVAGESGTVKVWYKPTKVGKHTGYFNTDNPEATADNKNIKLNGVATDAANLPQLTVSPVLLLPFTAVVGEHKSDTVYVTSANCTENISITVSHNEGAAFTINGSELPKNMDSVLTVITFAPVKAGAYTSTITWSSSGAPTRTMIVTGVAIDKPQEQPDYDTAFVWHQDTALRLLREDFESVTLLNHNKPLAIDNWQNVVLQGTRPWWGYEDRTSFGGPVEERCAKVTTYGYQDSQNKDCEMWLVTPALDYKNAANQVFTFRVRGDYLYEGQSAKLQLMYIDATDTADVYMQDLEIAMPNTADQAGDWLDFQVNLTGQETIADTFFMGFRFTGVSGAEGAAVYLIDDVSWGRDDLPLITTDSVQIVAVAEPNTTVAFPVIVTGKNLTEDITVTIGGNNRSKFEVAPASLPKEGGALAVGFKSEATGVHEAYLRIRSRGAVDVYVPIAVLVKQQTAVDDVSTPDTTATRLVIENGNLYIRTANGKRYTLTGTEM